MVSYVGLARLSEVGGDLWAPLEMRLGIPRKIRQKIR